MSKFLFAASITFLMTGATYAAQAKCDINQETHSTVSTAKVDVNFNQSTTATLSNGKTQDFSLITQRVNPDSSIEYIEIDGYIYDHCDHEYLFAADSGANNGVKAICMDKKAITTISCIYTSY